jgi:two-component system, sensor histidine kinase and response regulator
VLMDVQMPEMDGFEATVAIRRAEAGTHRHQPIVALTAHAMAADRERCLLAGFDEYVAKPVKVEKLFTAIAAVLPAANEGGNGRPVEVETSTEAIAEESLDREAILSRVDGDLGLLEEVVNLLSAEAPRVMGEANQALQAADGPRLTRAAHQLKGTLANFGPSRALELARGIEAAGRTEAFDSASVCLRQADAALKGLLDRLHQLCQGERA